MTPHPTPSGSPPRPPHHQPTSPIPTRPPDPTGPSPLVGRSGRAGALGRYPADRGAATIYAAVVGLLLVLAGLGIAVQASRLIRAAQAQAAADFGALAGARHAAFGASAACTRAADIAARNDATVVSCRLDGPDLTLTVQTRDVQATARAGPVRSPDANNAEPHRL